MNKKLFNFRLFADTFRQLRIVGLTATIIISIFAAIVPIGEYISSYKHTVVENGVQRVIYNTAVVSSLEIQPLAVLTYIVVAPLLVISAFYFLNKRNASDFYHAIPETRSCIFISLFSACISWVAIVLLSSTAVTLITTGILHKFFIVNYSTVFISLFTLFSAALLVAASVAAAMTFTGTLFNNIFVSALIIFVPRLFIFIINGFVTDSIPFLVSNNSDNWFLSPTINLAFGTISSVLYGNYIQMIYNIPSGIYSLCLGLAIGALALWGFNRRKSEAAGNAAASKRLSAVYRIALASAISLIPCIVIFNIFKGETEFDSEILFSILILYIIVVLAYCIYELISSKKFSSLLKSLPGLIYVAAANGLILLVMFGYNSYLVNFAPKADKIASINMVNQQSIYNTERNYILDRAEKTDITDKKAIEIVSKSLQKNVKLYNESKDKFENYYYGSTKGSLLLFRVNTAFRSEIREVLLTDKEYDYIIETLENNEDYRNLFYDLPTKNIGVKVWSHNSESVNFTDHEEKIYKLYLEDMKSIPLKEQMDNVSHGANEELGAIEIEFSHGLNAYNMYLSITKSHKKTVEYIYKLAYESYAKNRDSVLNRLRNLTPEMLDEKMFYIDIHNITNEDGEPACNFNYLDKDRKADPEILKQLADYLESCPKVAPMVDDPFIDVMIEIPPSDSSQYDDIQEGVTYEEYKNITARFALPSDKLPDNLHSRIEFELYD